MSPALGTPFCFLVFCSNACCRKRAVGGLVSLELGTSLLFLWRSVLMPIVENEQ